MSNRARPRPTRSLGRRVLHWRLVFGVSIALVLFVAYAAWPLFLRRFVEGINWVLFRAPLPPEFQWFAWNREAWDVLDVANTSKCR